MEETNKKSRGHKTRPEIKAQPGRFPILFNATGGQVRNELAYKEFDAVPPKCDDYIMMLAQYFNIIRGNTYTPALLRAALYIAMAKKLYHCANTRVLSPDLAALAALDFEIPSLIFKIVDHIGDFTYNNVEYQVRHPLTTIHRSIFCAQAAILFPDYTIDMLWEQTSMFSTTQLGESSMIASFDAEWTNLHIYAINAYWEKRPYAVAVNRPRGPVMIKTAVHLDETPVGNNLGEKLALIRDSNIVEVGAALTPGDNVSPVLTAGIDITLAQQFEAHHLGVLGSRVEHGLLKFDRNFISAVVNAIVKVLVHARQVINGRMNGLHISGFVGCGSVVQTAIVDQGRVESICELDSSQMCAAYFGNFGVSIKHEYIFTSDYHSLPTLLDQALRASFPQKT